MSNAFIERVVLPTTDLPRSLEVYGGVLGFEQTAVTPEGLIDLDQSGADGGGIRLAPVEGGERPRATLDRPGPYGLTLYTTRFDEVIDELGQATGRPPVAITYPFPGTGEPVKEGFVPGPDGLNIFLVAFDPGRHRCRLNDDASTGRVSEVAAMGCVVGSIEQSLSGHEQELGARTYLNESFGGAEVERMNGLEPGQSLHVAFLRGVCRGSARLELLERVPQAGGDAGFDQEGNGIDGVRLTCRVPAALATGSVSLVPGVVLDRVAAPDQTE